MNPALALTIIGAVLGLAGFALNRAIVDHTVDIETETDRAVYAALLARLTLLCRETAMPVTTVTQCLWVKVDGVGKSFRFYTSASPSCSPEHTIQINFLTDYETIEIIPPGSKPYAAKARLIVAEIDKYMANPGLACVTE